MSTTYVRDCLKVVVREVQVAEVEAVEHNRVNDWEELLHRSDLIVAEDERSAD